MKKNLIILSIIITCVVMYFIFFHPTYKVKNPLVIALSGPMSTPSGEAMKRGAMLYKDIINSNGGIHGRNVKLLVYDDENRPEKAKEIATQIAEENQVLLVLGHFDSECSIEAGKVYKRNEIPVITASATAKSVIKNNEWYFRVVSDNSQEADFVSKYIEKGLKEEYVSIIYSDDEMGHLFERYVNASELSLIRKWKWEVSRPHNEQLRKIEKDLERIKNPGVIFLATNSEVGAIIVQALKNKGKIYKIIGSHAFGETFVKEIGKQIRKPFGGEFCFDSIYTNANYYCDSIYYVTPFMDEIGGGEALRYNERFKEKYGRESGEVSAVYYDAMMAGAAAIKKTGSGINKGIRQVRRIIRAALSDFYNEDNVVKGITGNIYFDEDGGVRKDYVVGTWHKSQKVPALTQYSKVSRRIDNLIKKNLDGTVILIKDDVLRKIRVVYVKTQVIDVSHINSERSEFVADFTLSLRYKSYPDDDENQIKDNDIEFQNTVHPIKIGKPVIVEDNGITTKKYRVKGKFRAEFDYHGYPLYNQHTLPIRFYHNTETKDKLIYIPEEDESKPLAGHSSDKRWNILAVTHYQDILSNNTTLGNPKYFGKKHVLNFSRFNTEIKIKRTKKNIYASAKYLPSLLKNCTTSLPKCAFLLAMQLLMAYLLFFISHDNNMKIMFYSLIALVIVIGLHMNHVKHLKIEWFTVMDWGYFVVLLLVVMTMILSLAINNLNKSSNRKKAKAVFGIVRVGYTVLYIAFSFMFAIV